MDKTAKDIKIITDGELKKYWIEVINSNVPTNEEVWKNMSKGGKCYLVVNGKSHIDKYYKTKSARKYVIKQLGKSYYDEYFMETRYYGSGLKVVEIKADEIVKTNDPSLFYKWLYNEYRHLGGSTINRYRVKHYFDKYEMEKIEDIKYIFSDKHLDQIDRGQFDIIDKYRN